MWGFVWTTVQELYAACVFAVHRVYLFIVAYARLHFERFPPPEYKSTEPSWKITKVLAFCEDEYEHETDFADVTEWFSIDSWCGDVKEAFPTWMNWKLEIRYMHNGEKFRHVMRPGDPLIWPPPHADEHTRKLHELSKPIGILSASLVPSPGIQGAKEVNITHRIRKYAGVTRDFSMSSNLRAHDVFPMDDNSWNAKRFEAIRIIKAHPVECVRIDNINFAENGPIVEKKK